MKRKSERQRHVHATGDYKQQAMLATPQQANCDAKP
jgi:hypothetical protein